MLSSASGADENINRRWKYFWIGRQMMTLIKKNAMRCMQRFIAGMSGGEDGDGKSTKECQEGFYLNS